MWVSNEERATHSLEKAVRGVCLQPSPSHCWTECAQRFLSILDAHFFGDSHLRSLATPLRYLNLTV